MALPAVLPALLDPTRLRLAGLLAGANWTTAELTGEVELSERVVLEALAVLQKAGLAESTEDGWTIPAATLRTMAQAAAEADLPMDPYIGFGMQEEERLVLSRYFEGRLLTEIPSSRAKRRIVLERLALEFDIGKRYGEDEVNELLDGALPNEDWDTIGGLVFSTLGHVPRNGEEFEFDGWHLTAHEVVGRRVRRVKIGRSVDVGERSGDASTLAGDDAAGESARSHS